MADTRRDSEAVLQAARQSLAVQQSGGRHRRATAAKGSVGKNSVGQGSAALKRRTYARRAKLFAAALGAILVAAIAAGIVLDGIGFTGIVVTVLAILAALVVFANFPRVRTPRRADLNQGDARQMVARTELWLEHQRPALPPPAVAILDQMGVQLDALGAQLEHVDPAHPAAHETRKLVGEHLPEMIETYRKVPAHLRHERGAGGVPDEQLAEGLDKISREIEQVTRQLADGALDDLAIRSRFLEYRYGDGPASAASPEP